MKSSSSVCPGALHWTPTAPRSPRGRCGIGAALRCAVAALALWSGAAPGQTLFPARAAAGLPSVAGAAAQQLAAQVLIAADHRERPFAVVDKRAATITVFDADGRRLASSPVLLGVAPGDRAVPGAGERAQQGSLQWGDQTTPAGRFDSEPGRNRDGEAIVWVDYDSALAIHRVRPGPGQAERIRRLASDDARDKRVSAGCVVVPAAFFDEVIQPLFGRRRGVVYVMPEEGSWQRLWPSLAGAGA